MRQPGWKGIDSEKDPHRSSARHIIRRRRARHDGQIGLEWGQWNGQDYPTFFGSAKVMRCATTHSNYRVADLQPMAAAARQPYQQSTGRRRELARWMSCEGRGEEGSWKLHPFWVKS